jgi:hypothetical protein
VFVADSADGLVWLVVLLGLYFVPTIVAFARDVSSKGSVAVINVFLGWTLIGWIVALAMAARSVPQAELPPPPKPTRACPTCKAAMPRDESVCPNCGNPSAPWVLHAGVWWSKGVTDEWNWIDDDGVWRKYKDGTPSSPTATDMTPNLRIDPAIVRPPDAPELAQITASRPTGDSVASELERLADLHARGALSDDQFEAAKARLLES